jgi:hypothetical protein
MSDASIQDRARHQAGSQQGEWQPLDPRAGFAVLCGYAAVAVALAVMRPRRRDA